MNGFVNYLRTYMELENYNICIKIKQYYFLDFIAYIRTNLSSPLFFNVKQNTLISYLSLY